MNYFYSCIIGLICIVAAICFLFLPSSSSSGITGLLATIEPTYKGGAIGEQFAPYLIQLHDGAFEKFDPSHLKQVRYYAFYFSASWCPPCRAFTPKLMTFYRHFKRTHPNFELIFVCEDRSASDMQNYMRGDDMPWPAVEFDAPRTVPLGLNRFLAPFVPNLVLADSDGNVLSQTMVDGMDRGPLHVIDDIWSMVPEVPQ